MAKSKSVWSIVGLVARIITRIAVLAACVMLLIYAGRAAYGLGYGIFDFSPVDKEPGQDVVITVQEDMSARSLGKLLAEKGLVRDANVYWVQSYVYEYDPLPGTYMLNTSQTLDQMMTIMSDASNSTKKE